jgi:hypothetical protein
MIMQIKPKADRSKPISNVNPLENMAVSQRAQQVKKVRLL